MLLESKKVKVAGLGTFYLTCECVKGGANSEAEFNVKEHLNALHIRFLPDQAQEDNLSSREFIKKAEFVNIKSLLSGEDDESGETGESGSSGSSSQTNGTNGTNGTSGTGDSGNTSGDSGNTSGDSGNTGGSGDDNGAGDQD